MTKSPLFKIFRVSGFSQVIISYFVFSFGYTIAQIAMYWHLNINYNPTVVATTLFFSTIGSFITAIPIGFLLDKFKAQKIVLYTALLDIIFIGSIILTFSLQGKMFSYTMVINKLGTPMGELLAGSLLTYLSYKNTIIIYTVILLLAVLVSVSIRDFRKTDIYK